MLARSTVAWIGGSDMENEGEWIWAASQRRITDLYNDWSTEDGSPPVTQRQDCLKLSSRLDNGHWTDSNCDQEFKFICEF